MRRRLSIAIALVGSPPVLFFDGTFTIYLPLFVISRSIPSDFL